ncbi:MAG: ABC transporter substrate-binding protein [Chloroflexi bacterium]|nr:ABC transporter substrate-binding protein [Chloroflexota bacterium]
MVLVVVPFLTAACSTAAPAPSKPAGKAAEVKPAEKAAVTKPAEKPAEANPAAKGTLKIGYLTSFTGVFSGLGKDMKDGFLQYTEEKGGQLGGRKIELIVEDDEGKPDVGLTKIKKLIEKDNVQMVAGIVSSGVALVGWSNKEIDFAGGTLGDLLRQIQTRNGASLYEFLVENGEIKGDYTVMVNEVSVASQGRAGLAMRLSEADHVVAMVVFRAVAEGCR